MIIIPTKLPTNINPLVLNNMMCSSYSSILPTLLAVASTSIIPSVAAQELTTDALEADIATNPAPPGKNIAGGSVFENFVKAYNQKEFFFTRETTTTYEKPGSDPVITRGLYWCGDLAFTDFINNSSKPKGFAGRCVSGFWGGYEAATEAGAELEFDDEKSFTDTDGISAVFVEQLNIFEGEFHRNNDNGQWRFWDDGRETSRSIGWEVHDDGNLSPNEETSAFSMVFTMTWITAAEAAEILTNMTADDLTPEKFKDVYADAWIESHEYEAKYNPDGENALDAVEEVKEETGYDGDSEPKDAPANNEGSATDADAAGGDAASADEDSGSGTRKLASTTARVATAVLRMFGI